MIFQDPYNALNPRMSVGDTIAEVLHVHDKSAARADRRGASWNSCRSSAFQPNMPAASPRPYPAGSASASALRAPLRSSRN